MRPAKFRSGIFISYSHADQGWLGLLQKHLAPYLRDERLEIWDDTKIAPGARWDDEIERALSAARVAVLLVSPDFLASDYIAHVELPAALRRAGSDLTVVWIPIRPSAYEATPLMEFQAAHDPKQPLASLTKSKQDEALVAIAKKIVSAVDINALGNGFRVIDEFTPQVAAFVAGSPEPEKPGQFSQRAEQVEASIRLVDSGGSSRQLITASDFEKFDANDRKLIRAYERTMTSLLDRWTELKPKRVAQDSEIRQTAREESDEVRKEMCAELKGLLGFIESMGFQLCDHYNSIRYECGRPAA